MARLDARLGLGQRVLIFWCVTWLPIVLMTLIRWAQGGLSGPYLQIASGLGIHVRLLFGGAVLILGERLIDTRVTIAARQFLGRRVLEESGRYFEIIAKVERRIKGLTGILVETALLVVSAVSAIASIYSNDFGMPRDWKAIAPGIGLPMELVWYAGIGAPLLAFLLLRWLWRFSVWAMVLLGISHLDLRLNASHPDLAGGISFIGFAQESFALLGVAVSSFASAAVAFRVRSLGVPLEQYYAPIGAVIAVEALVFVVPLLFFVPHLIRSKRGGLISYGALSADYVSEFDRKWILGKRERAERLLGNSDIEQWANVGIGLERSRQMRPIPALPSSVGVIMLAGALPFVPLALLQVPAAEILKDALKLLV